MTPDWTTAPPGATHYNIHTHMWYRRKFYDTQVWSDGSWKYTHSAPPLDDKRHFMERPE